MLKRILLLTAAIVAEALFADAVAVGKTRDGYPLIVPQVRKLDPAAGKFIRPPGSPLETRAGKRLMRIE